MIKVVLTAQKKILQSPSKCFIMQSKGNAPCYELKRTQICKPNNHHKFSVNIMKHFARKHGSGKVQIQEFWIFLFPHT